MQLLYMPSSPYVRKVCVAAIEAGVDDLIERVDANISDKTVDIRADNPLGKVPVLRLKNGDVIFDSIVICEFLDSMNDDVRLFPAYGPRRWEVLTHHALADGIIDATWLRRREGLRKPEQRSQGAIKHHAKAIAEGLDAFEAALDEVGTAPTIGTITLAVALGYLDFRAPDDDWRAGRPGLTEWYAAFSERQSMRSTEPRASA